MTSMSYETYDIEVPVISSKALDILAARFGTERMYDGCDEETDDQFRARLVNRFMRFKDTSGTFYDLVHKAEQAILHESPVGCDYIAIRRQVGLGLIAKNKTGNWFTRLKTACKAFWSCL